MSWKLTDSFAPVSRLWRTLAFRLTAAYALAGLFLVFLATASLYLLTSHRNGEKHEAVYRR